ncbi:MAG: ATP-binding protein, partial [Infirmifilum sp.]
ETVIDEIRDEKDLNTFITSLTDEERGWLAEAINNPDTLMRRERIPLMNRLIKLNMIMSNLPSRNSKAWIDEPPPERDLELGIGRYVAWQTPLHRDAVRRVLGASGSEEG